MRLPRPCLDCATLTTNPTRCTPCSSAHTSAHRTARHRAAVYVDTGLTRCSRCGHPLHPGRHGTSTGEQAAGHQHTGRATEHREQEQAAVADPDQSSNAQIAG